MNVYDEANALAKALQQSDEYKKMDVARKRLESEPEHMAMAKDYMQKQMMAQTKQMMGQELTEEEVASYNSLTNTMMGIPVIAEFFQAQMVFSMVFQDIMDIISKAVNLDMGMFDDEGSAC